MDKIVCFKLHFYQLQTRSNLCYQLAAHISKMKVCLVSGLFFLCVKWVVRHFGRFYLSLLVGCLSLWMGNSLPLAMVRYPVCPCDRTVLVIGTSILVSEFAIIASNLFISVDCLSLRVGCLSVSVVVCPYE